MAGPNRFMDGNSSEKKELKRLLGYLETSIENGTEVDLVTLKGCIENSKFSPEDFEEIRAKALKGARKYGEQAYKNPSDKSIQTLAGAYATIAAHTAKKSGYRHDSSGLRGLELGD